MPTRNLHGGKSFKKSKKGSSEIVEKFVPKEEGQEYARIIKILGDRRATCFCNDGKERIGKFRGAICRGPKKQIVRSGDIVLMSLRDFVEDDVCDILLKYERQDWSEIRTERGIHKCLFGEEEDTYFEDEEKVYDDESENEVNMDDL